ncbi:hypothetical protein H5410_032695 [Solanum commersonii]|uniref:Uncharacterized protein n=1 Tax=Solanum commersonii TaxID=4109 RepID=A0A9J5YMZ7_SOLCO|nr:hypothetical protein H5410_032695 [Solanum commersonii]
MYESESWSIKQCHIQRLRLAELRMLRGRGKPEKYYGKVIRHDMIHIQFIEDMVLDRKLQKT